MLVRDVLQREIETTFLRILVDLRQFV